MYSDFSILQDAIIKWANDRNIINGSDPRNQFHKLIQECAELSDNLCKGNDTTDDFGDVLVVLIVMAKQCNIDLIDALKLAYNEIKDRKGTMINGVFVKEV